MVSGEGALPAEIQAQVDAELASGERVLWQGQPIGRFAPGGIALALFGIPWTAFALFWIWGASHAVGAFGALGMLFPLFGLPFVLVGFGLISAPWWMRLLARRTAYVITNQRVLILSPGWRGRSVRSFAPERLTVIERRERSDGSGDLIFEKSSWRDSDGDRRTREVGFMSVPDVKLVERMVRALADSDSVRQPQG